MAKIVRASKRNPCPVCGRKKWPCYVLNGEVAYCESVTGDVTDKQGRRWSGSGG